MTVAEARCRVEFCDEWFDVEAHEAFVIGREGALEIDDNPYLHRHFLEIRESGGLWWLVNIGSRLSATVTDGDGGVQAWLPPGGRLPLVFGVTSVIFTAGPTTYQLQVHSSAPTFALTHPHAVSGATTIGRVQLTPAQKALVVALCEPMLRREGVAVTELPSSAAAAARLGWAMTRFNRKLDNVCDKLDRAGVRGLRGGPGRLATQRRARLAEYAVSSRLVTPVDLELLDRVPDDEGEAS